MMRISATTLESFNLFLTTDWYSEEKLIATIRQDEEELSEHARMGRIFHLLFEKPEVYREPDCYRVDDVAIPHGVVDLCLQHVQQYTGCSAVNELKTTKVYDLGSEKVKVVSRVDAISTGIIVEFKTLWTPFRDNVIDRYLNSVQWMYYLDAFEALYLQYIVFNLEKKNGLIRLDGVYPIECYPCSTLTSDCISHLREFVSYIKFRKLEGFFCDKEDDPHQYEQIFSSHS